MAPRFKKLTDCPENLREAIDWLIQVRHGGDKTGIEKLTKALKEFIAAAIWNTQNSLDRNREEVQKLYDLANRSSKLVKLNEQEKAFEKLQRSLEPFLENFQIASKYSEKNIIMQLCSGIEKILGYNSKTKGYTGEGIVYSDLDRLADGMMAFLYGVLESVKEDETVKTYWNNINNDSMYMKKELETGKDGLKRLLPVLQFGLNDYMESLTVKTDNVYNIFSELNKIIDNEIKNIPERQVQCLQYQFEEWKETTQRLVGISDEANSACAGLDSELQNKLDKPVTVVKEAVKMLNNTGQVRGLVNAVETVQNTFDKMPQQVDYFITANVNSTTQEHEKSVKEFIAKTKKAIEDSRNAFLKERLNVAKANLDNALRCAQENAVNLGGLQNDKVKNAINGIETMLKSLNSGTDTVEDAAVLGKLRTGIVRPHIHNITGELNKNASKITKELSELDNSIGGPGDVFKKHENALAQLVSKAGTYLKHAVDCAQENSLNLGGLQNDKVVDTIKAIQDKLEKVDAQINSKSELDNLKNTFMERQLRSITNALNDGKASTVITQLRTLSNDIGQPQDKFANYKLALDALALQAQNDLEKYFAGVQDCIQTHGGLNNDKVKKAIKAIHAKLESVDKDKIYTMAQLRDLAKNPVQQHARAIKGQINGKASEHTTELHDLDNGIESPEKIFDANHRKTLEDLAQSAEKDLMAAVGKAKEYIKCTDFGLKKQIEKAFGEVLQGFKKGQNTVTLLKPKVKPALSKISEGISTTYQENMASHFSKLSGYINGIDGDFNSAFKGAIIIESELTSWVKRMTTHLINVLSSANDEISKVEIKYVEEANKELEHIEMAVQGLAKKAQSDELRSVADDLRRVEMIILAVSKYSVYKDDDINRTSYFTKLNDIISHTINALQVAYQKAYQSAAKSYLSGAISKITEKVQKAGQVYEQTVTSIRMRIESIVHMLQTKARNDDFTSVTSDIAEQFQQLTAVITTKSVFLDDITEREKYFENIRDVINTTVRSLESAYQKAYQSAAKSYLSGAISKIKEKVEAAEGTYKAAIKEKIGQLKINITGISNEKFKDTAETIKLEKLFEDPFRDLLSTVDKSSAFTEDASKRTTCFTRLKELIKHKVTTLNAAYTEAYQCSAKTYLTKAVEQIKNAVQAAEKQYKTVVDAEVKKITSKIKELSEQQFAPKIQREGLATLFDGAFEQLEQQIKLYSAFNGDFASRMSCFEQFQQLIKDTVKTLVNSYELFDSCAAKAEDYLGKAFNDTKTKLNAVGYKVRDKVKKSFDQIVSEVYTMYSIDKVALLKSLRTCVEEQKEEVGRIIGLDLKKGIKGFLRLLRTWVEMNNAGLVKAPDLKSLADLFKHLYTHLHRYVKFQHDDLEVEGDSDDEKNDNSQNQVAIISVPRPSPVKAYGARPAIPAVKSQTNAGANHLGRVGMSHMNNSTVQQSSALQATKDPIAEFIESIKLHSERLFGTLSAGHFSKSFASKHKDFVEFLESMSPFKFGEHCDPSLDVLQSGLQSFLKKLRSAYISTYYGAADVLNWAFDGEKCAKVFMTILEILYHDLDGLRNNCKDAKLYRTKKLCLKEDDNRSANHLGIWFDHRGFTVSDNKDKQDGELDTNKTGENIIGMIAGTSVKTAAKNIYKGQDDTTGALKSLHTYLEDYYRVCHHRLIPDARAPTTIYEMLHWLCGLWYNPVADPLRDSLRKLLEDVERENKIETDKLKVALPYRRSVSMSRTLTRSELIYVFNNSTIRANLLLIAIQGHGQADGRYACDFLTNPDDLLYPSNPDKCLDLLVEVCLRVNHQVRFLYKQCHNGPSCGGWRDCLYGKGIGGSRWQCNKLQCPNQECEQKCRQHYSCGIKSPLQLFLEDGLPGFLPHRFEKPDCKITCSLPNHNGIPCKTPMGFRDLSIRASHQQKGERIKKVLDWFCGTENESLNLLCSYFLLLLRRSPQTLCDMFAFYYNFLDHYDDDKGEQKKHRRLAFKDAVTKANLGRPFDALSPSTILCTSKHNPSDGEPTHEKGDLFSLLSCNPEDSPTMPCGRYLQSIGDDIRVLYYGEYASLYLSWVIYQAETFYNLLKDLCDKCCRNCTSPESICYGTRCANDCKVKSVYEANKSDDHKAELKQLPDKNHDETCDSIINCSNTHSVLYTYGFTFGSPFDLSGEDNRIAKKRTCKDFCRALGNVLNKDKQVEAPLAKLVFDIIPEYLWQIRQPFSYLVLTLWLLSLLYITHIMVIRLDLLHIKSHLHSPSSHRIAAQSLLAASRVKSLNKVLYLQP